MGEVDALVIAALPEEHEAARQAATTPLAGNAGVASWRNGEPASPAPYLVGSYEVAGGQPITVALARPTRMGSDSTASVAASLVERLRPQCLAMCGVCAGNPGAVALGDVVISEMAYRYTEGKQTRQGFLGDLRPVPVPDPWLRAAQEMKPDGLPTYSETASEEDAQLWFLERLHSGDQPRAHPALRRYFPGDTWRTRLEAWRSDGLLTWTGADWQLTEAGRERIQYALYHDVNGPERLPFAIKVGPIASGDVVVKDGLTWGRLARRGVRSVVGLDMEAASIATIAHRLLVPSWVVVKGVMDHADPRKDDRYKPFAARASAQVLWAFLARQVRPAVRDESPEKRRIRRAVDELLRAVDMRTSPGPTRPSETDGSGRAEKRIADAGARLLGLLNELDELAARRARDPAAAQYRYEVRDATGQVMAAYRRAREVQDASDLVEAAGRLRQASW